MAWRRSGVRIPSGPPLPSRLKIGVVPRNSLSSLADERFFIVIDTGRVDLITRTKYNPREVESKWQAQWEADHLCHTSDDSSKPKFYHLVMFPYPSGDLHMGHWYNYSPFDSYGRFKRMQDYNVMQPIGFDAFGLPAENAAIKRGVQARTWTLSNIDNMRKQLRAMGAQ